MKKVARKSIFIYDYDEIEKWLNEMAEDGFALNRVVGGNYEFDETEKGEYKIAILFLEKIYNYKKTNEQIEIIQQTGAEFVGMNGRWAFFRRKSELGDFVLFSDNTSKIKYMSHILYTTISLILSANLVLFMNTVNYISLLAPTSAIHNIWYLMLIIIDITATFWGIKGAIKLAKKRKELKQQATLFE